MVWPDQTIVCSHQTMVCCRQTKIVWERGISNRTPLLSENE
ncbi:hypothetical protein GCWU000325_00513 [Alloprevotella tannerae ATCC 51259]|uniref:Uncharacterized protein n=1 Tax=Alloprevotella tannerae ATCC 51259 TaxID=626522 RepID=C9LE87_9BACT|nr:hypothetical protein GCWU000325_00513 [Alloprevotella tannerae ATCC 51259]